MSWREQLSEMERFQLDIDLETKQYLKGQINHLTKRLGTLSHQVPWASMAMYLMQIPGFGVITPMTVMACAGYLRYPAQFSAFHNSGQTLTEVELEFHQCITSLFYKAGGSHRLRARWLQDVSQKTSDSPPKLDFGFYQLVLVEL